MGQNKQKWLSYAYWTLPIILIIFQLVYTFNSLGQIRTEEAIDSIRSVWWFQNRLVTDGGYSILGWYTVLFIAYNIFGFTLHAAKFVKLGIVLIGLFSLASVFKKYLGVKAVWLPLLTIGLSPALLFFNTLQVAYGIEVSYFFICLYFLSILDFRNKNSLLITALLFVIAMFGWLTYPGFLNYLFIIWSIYIYKLRHSGKEVREGASVSRISTVQRDSGVAFDRLRLPRMTGFALIFFLIPLILEILYIQNRHLLLYDRTFQRGLFRSNGGLEVNPNIFLDNVKILFNDLFVGYNSYYFETPKVEFSDYYPLATIIFVFASCIYIYLKKKKLRFILLSLGLFLITFLVTTNLVGPMGLGGIRRATVVVILFYLLFALVWKFVLELKRPKPILSYTFISICCLLLVHHILVYPTNLAHLREPTPYKEKMWFTQENTPEKSLGLFVNRVQKEDLFLQCKDQKQNIVNCGGYSVIHATIEGSCYWNKLYCHKILGYDTKLKIFIPLSFDFYKNNNWER